MPISNYAQLQSFISDTLKTLGVDAEFAPHAEFWSSLSYEEFTQGNVPGVGGGVRILLPGDAASSQIIHALKGEGQFAGNPFDRMPSGGPFMSDQQIAEIAGWINAGCPEFDAGLA